MISRLRINPDQIWGGRKNALNEGGEVKERWYEICHTSVMRCRYLPTRMRSLGKVELVTGMSELDKAADNQAAALLMLSALGQQTRLDVYKLLVEAGTGGMIAGDIAKALEAPHNTLSTHLSILQRAGLVRSEKTGRNVTYLLEPSALNDLVTFLLRDCSNIMHEVECPSISLERNKA